MGNKAIQASFIAKDPDRNLLLFADPAVGTQETYKLRQPMSACRRRTDLSEGVASSRKELQGD